MSHPDYEKKGSRLDHLQEECAELIVAIGKARRFGFFNRHPETGLSNRVAVLVEIQDVEKRIAEVKEILTLGMESKEE